MNPEHSDLGTSDDLGILESSGEKVVDDLLCRRRLEPFWVDATPTDQHMVAESKYRLAVGLVEVLDVTSLLDDLASNTEYGEDGILVHHVPCSLWKHGLL